MKIEMNKNYKGTTNVSINCDVIGYDENIVAEVSVDYTLWTGDDEELTTTFEVLSCNYKVDAELNRNVKIILDECLRDYLVEYLETGKKIVLEG